MILATASIAVFSDLAAPTPARFLIELKTYAVVTTTSRLRFDCDSTVVRRRIVVERQSNGVGVSRTEDKSYTGGTNFDAGHNA